MSDEEDKPLVQNPDEPHEYFRARAVAHYRTRLHLAPQWVRDEIKKEAADELGRSRNSKRRTETFHDISSVAMDASLDHIRKVQNGELEPDRLYRDLLISFANHESKLDIERQKYENLSLLEAQRQTGEENLLQQGKDLLTLNPNFKLDITNLFLPPPPEDDNDSGETGETDADQEADVIDVTAKDVTPDADSRE